MNKSVWLSFDLGVNGDYEGMYAWLDSRSAKECGDNMAYLEYDVGQVKNLLMHLKKDIKNAVELNKKSRIYVIHRVSDQVVKGTFLFGSRKQAPWTGYGESEETSSDES